MVFVRVRESASTEYQPLLTHGDRSHRSSMCQSYFSGMAIITIYIMNFYYLRARTTSCKSSTTNTGGVVSVHANTWHDMAECQIGVQLSIELNYVHLFLFIHFNKTAKLAVCRRRAVA